MFYGFLWIFLIDNVRKALWNSAQIDACIRTYIHLLPTGSEDKGVLVVGNIPVAILPSCQDMKYIAL